jgi:hypothetical protein
MTLKIAFLISGEARNFIYTTFSFKKYVFDSCKNADIYISFKENSRTRYTKEEVNNLPEKYKTPLSDDIPDEIYLNAVFGEKLKYFGYDDEIYIKKLIDEKLESISEDLKKYATIGVLDQYARVRNIAEIFQKEAVSSYDIIVRLRLDSLWWVTKLEIEKYINNLNKIYFSYINWKRSKYNGNPNWIQDFFFMGKPELVLYVMKNFFNELYTSKEYLEEHELNNAPELQLGNYINSNKYFKNLIEVSKINRNLCALAVKRPAYLKGYLVGTYNDVYKSLNIYLKNNFKALKQNQSCVEMD